MGEERNNEIDVRGQRQEDRRSVSGHQCNEGRLKVERPRPSRMVLEHLQKRGAHALVEKRNPDGEEEPDEDRNGGLVSRKEEDKQRRQDVADGDRDRDRKRLGEGGQMAWVAQDKLGLGGCFTFGGGGPFATGLDDDLCAVEEGGDDDEFPD